MEKKKYDFRKPLIDIDGKEGDSFDKFAIMSVNAPKQGLSGAELLDRFELAMKVKNAPETGIELSNVEKTMIIDAIREVFPSPTIYKRFKDLLEL